MQQQTDDSTVRVPCRWKVLPVAFRPICCLHFGPASKEKPRFLPFLGIWRRFEGNVGTFWGGHFYNKIGKKMRCLAKMLAADQSNAKLLPELHFQHKQAHCTSELQPTWQATSGKWARNWKWPKSGWRNDRGPFFGEGPKMAEKWPDSWKPRVCKMFRLQF